MPPFDASKYEPMPDVELDPEDEFHVGQIAKLDSWERAPLCSAQVFPPHVSAQSPWPGSTSPHLRCDSSGDTSARCVQGVRRRGRMTDALGWRAKFGVLAPSTNTIVEPDFYRMSVPGVTAHFSHSHP